MQDVDVDGQVNGKMGANYKDFQETSLHQSHGEAGRDHVQREMKAADKTSKHFLCRFFAKKVFHQRRSQSLGHKKKIHFKSMCSGDVTAS